MTVLEMMKQDVNSVVGKTISYDFGGTKPLLMNVVATRKNIQKYTNEEGDVIDLVTYCVSENGMSFYCVSCKDEVVG